MISSQLLIHIKCKLCTYKLLIMFSPNLCRSLSIIENPSHGLTLSRVCILPATPSSFPRIPNSMRTWDYSVFVCRLSATYKSVQSVVKASVYKNLRSLWVMCIMLKHWQGKPWHQRHKLSWEHWYTPFAHYQRLRAKRPRDLDHDIVYTLCTHKTWLQIHTQIWELKIDVLLGKALINSPFGLMPF